MNPHRRTARWMIAGVLTAAALAFVPGNDAIPGTEASARLIAFQPMPAVGSTDQCTWETATPQSSLMSSRVPARPAAAQSAGRAASDARRAEVAARKPLRTIHDAYAGFSTVFVDAARNEVILGDEYNFDLYVYDRLANTPSSAEKTQPKRSTRRTRRSCSATST